MSKNEAVVRPSTLVGAADEADDDDETERGERRKFTQRMPEHLAADIESFAERHGMSRNAAINVLAKTGLEKF